MRNEDFDFVARTKPPVVKTVDADPSVVSRLYSLSPTSLFFIRSWSMSEQKEDMLRDPEGTGRRHAREWAERIDSYGPPRQQIIVPGINEPPVWEALDATVAYYRAFALSCTEHGIRGALLNLSVGWPANNGPDMPPDWSPYHPVLEAMHQGGGHVLVVHEYFDHRGPYFNEGWWCNRIKHCPWDVPIVIGECGLDEYVSNPGVDAQMRGWQGQLSPEQYAAYLYEYEAMLDSRVVGACVYSLDFSHPWSSFDVAGIRHLLA
jgi:hypothetical protein